MALHKVSPFMPKQNKDGSKSSICTTCFKTIGNVTIEADLRPLEVSHVCAAPLSTRVINPQSDGNSDLD
jgi:hypothetical protein